MDIFFLDYKIYYNIYSIIKYEFDNIILYDMCDNIILD